MNKQEFQKTVESFIRFLESSATVVIEERRGILVKIDSEMPGHLIGRHGETMKSIEYLIRLMFAKASGENTKITVDISGYKEKKVKELEELAIYVAKNVKQSGYAQELKPMNSYERLVIHTALADFKGVVTESIGEGDLRRVQVKPGK